MKQIGNQKKLNKNFYDKETILKHRGGGLASLVKDHTFTFFLDPSLSDTCLISLNTSPPRVKCDRYKMWQIAKIPPPMPQKRVTFTNYFFFNFRLQKCSPPTNLLCLSTFITILIMTSLFIHPWPDCLSLCAWSMFCNFL